MSTSQDDARRLAEALANIVEDPVRLVMAEWNSHAGRLMCEACHRTIESGHDEDCPHHQWILDVRLAVRRILSALTTEAPTPMLRLTNEQVDAFLAEAYATPTAETHEGLTMDLWQAICELPDRCSPEDEPEAAVVTLNELRNVVENVMMSRRTLTTEETPKESIRAALAAAFDAGVDAEQGGNFRPHGHEAKRFDVVNRLAPFSRSLTPDAGKDERAVSCKVCGTPVAVRFDAVEHVHRVPKTPAEFASALVEWSADSGSDLTLQEIAELLFKQQAEALSPSTEPATSGEAETLRIEVDRLETALAEAQQWLDSEPDWKAKFLAAGAARERQAFMAGRRAVQVGVSSPWQFPPRDPVTCADALDGEAYAAYKALIGETDSSSTESATSGETE